MNKRLLFVLLAVAAASLALGAGQASAWDRERSVAVDLATLVLYEADLLGLAETLPTFEATDTAIAGIADTEVGIDAAPSDPLADPPPWTTLVVDDDLVQCPNATYTSISAAVADAFPGDTIKVCPGTYNESVLVAKQLTLRGASHGGGEARCKEPVTPDPTTDSIVHYPPGAPGIGFTVLENGVVIDGFIVEPDTTVTANGVGIYTSPLFSGYLVRDNIAQNNSIGLYLNSSGAVQTVAKKNCLRDNNKPGAATGQGIYSDQGLQNALIEHNFSTLNLTSAITLEGLVATVSDITIRKNRSVVDDSAVALFNSSMVTVVHNKATDSTGAEIFIGPNNSDLHIVGNHLLNGAFRGIRFNALGGSPSVNVEVRDNQIQGMNSSGIGVAPNSLLTSTLSKNHSHDNGEDGIRIDAGTNSGNLITGNKLKRNAEHDCHDGTMGTGTGGTANTWTNNEGDTQNVPGLCKKATTTP
jgi:nitrous oxidase accessory protein NosD